MTRWLALSITVALAGAATLAVGVQGQAARAAAGLIPMTDTASGHISDRSSCRTMHICSGRYGPISSSTRAFPERT